MCPSLNSFGSTPSVSQLVWDSDLVIPEGKAIESASGEVGIIGDMSVSGSVSTDNVVTPLLTATNTDIDSLTVDGYTPKVLSTTGNVISYSGAPNTLIVCATVPSGGVTCEGTANITVDTWGSSNPVMLYAKCCSLAGNISDVLLGQGNPDSSSLTITFSSPKIPEGTQFITGFYVTRRRNSAVLKSVNITSSPYASKQLI